MKEPKFKSKFEHYVYHTALNDGHTLEYEPVSHKLKYILPQRSYNPDFLLPNGILIETKGFLRYDDLRKMQSVKMHNPDKDIRLVFMKADKPIRKGQPMTYGQWATKQGFPWAEGVIPEAWFNERDKT